MKKLLLQLTLVAGFTATCFTATSQLYLGGHLNYTRYLGGTGIGFLGLGLAGEKAIDDNTVRVAFNFGFPYKQDMTTSLYTNDFDNYAGEVNGVTKYSFLNLAIDYKFFVGDGDYEDGGFYLFGGVGLSMATVSYELEAYDENNYHTYYDYTSKDKYFQPILRGGLGYDISLNFGNLFFETFANIPANRVGGANVDINLPFSAGGQAGIRVPIGR